MSFAMKNMKFSKSDKPLSTDELMVQGGPEYPYGLRITLTPEVLKRLDLVKLPEVGQMMGLHAVVEVVGVNADRAANGGRDLRVELQITDLCLEAKSESAKIEQGDDDSTLLGSASKGY